MSYHLLAVLFTFEFSDKTRTRNNDNYNSNDNNDNDEWAVKISTSRGCLSEINEKINIEKIKEKLKTCTYYLDTFDWQPIRQE